MKKAILAILILSASSYANADFSISCRTVTLKPLAITIKTNDRNEFVGFEVNNLNLNSEPEVIKQLNEEMQQIIEYSASVTPTKTSESTDEMILDYNTVTQTFDGMYFHNIQYAKVTSFTKVVMFDCDHKN